MNEFEKITRNIIQPVKNLSLKLHAKLSREHNGRKENFHNEFEYRGKNYMRLDLQTFITLEKTDGDWSADKSIIIDQRNIYQIKKGLKAALTAVYDGGVFAVNKEGKSVIYSDMVEANTIKIYNLNYGNRLLIKPAIIFDENDVTYEGVILYINKTENYIELPIDALESLYYAIEQANLFVYSQLLINYFVLMLGKMEEIKEKEAKEKLEAKPIRKKNIFEKKDTDVINEEVKSVGMSTEKDIMDGVGE